MEVLAILGSSTAQQQQQNSQNPAVTKTEEPAEKTVQPATASGDSADAGHDNSASANDAAAQQSTAQTRSAQNQERASAETIFEAQLAPAPPAADLESLARASAERAQAEAKVQALLDGIATVVPEQAAAPETTQVNNDPTEPRAATPVDTYA